MITVLIPRKKWYRGKGPHKSFLRDENDMHCCLGFAARKCGATVDQITNQITPAEVQEKSNISLPGLTEGNLSARNTVVCCSLMTVNDDTAIGDTERERDLKDLARKAGYRFIFTNWTWVARVWNAL